jgi:hypothetical protein
MNAFNVTLRAKIGMESNLKIAISPLNLDLNEKSNKI